MSSLKCICVGLVVSLASVSHADFGEIDLIVQESIEANFRDNGQSVDVQRLSYIGNPKQEGRNLIIHSSVWGEQRQIQPYWGWYECTTTIEIKAPGQYVDKGSDCQFDAE